MWVEGDRSIGEAGGRAWVGRVIWAAATTAAICVWVPRPVLFSAVVAELNSGWEP